MRSGYRLLSRSPLGTKVLNRLQLSGAARAYWEAPWDTGNQPLAYATDGHDGSAFLVDTIKRVLPDRDAPILEIGCNAGRNLNALRNAGYRNLSGIELNPSAVEQMSVSYPDLNATVYEGAVEDIIGGLSETYELVFTMAVLMHIHPASDERIFPEIARVGERVLTIESERSRSWKKFRRDYGAVFSGLGMREVETQKLHEPKAFDEYTLRLFTRA